MLVDVALRNLGRNLRRTLTTGAAICFGVGAIVFADAWSRGIGRAIREYAAEGRLGALQLNAKGYLAQRNAWPLDLRVPSGGPLVAALSSVEGVTGVAPRVRFAGTISNGVDETMFLAHGIDPAAERRVCPRFLEGDLVNGRSVELGRAEVVVGDLLAQNLGLSLGSSVTLEARTVGGTVNAADYEVVGIATSSLPDEAKWLVVVPLDAAQSLLRMEGEASALVMAAADIESADALAQKVRAAIAPLGAFEVHTWRQVGLYFEQAIRTFAAAQGFLMVVLAILVALVIGNALMLTAFERSKELATWMALGAPRRKVRGVILLEALMLGLVAGALGALLGAGIATVCAHFGIPFKPPNQPSVLVRPVVSAGALFSTVLAAAIVATVAAVVPSILASRRGPARVLAEA